MKLLVAVMFVAGCSAARLENTYLPPASAFGAGGNGNFLGAPHASPGASQFGSGSGQYNSGQYSGRYTGSSGAHIPISRYNNDNQGDGNYQFNFETANGIKQHEQGHLASQDEEVVSGSYSYTGDDGRVYSVNYKADANGFQATGDHLPTPPPIPEAILKSLAFNAAEEARNPQGYQSGSSSGQYSSGSGGFSGQYSSGQYSGGSGQFSGGHSGHSGYRY